MIFGFPRLPGFVLIAFSLFCTLATGAQTKPVESTSKVKSVLLYNKIGGWVHTEGIEDVRKAFKQLAGDKGFALTESITELDLTPEFLRQFQVIVWNNNTDGASSVPNLQARQAVMDYLEQGGGWLLIHGAGWVRDTWPAQLAALGTQFYSHSGSTDDAYTVIDQEARTHRELKWMVAGIPDSLKFRQSWDTYQNTVRGVRGVTMIATLDSVPGSSALQINPPDGSGEWPLAWAREVGLGRLIFNGFGHGQDGLMTQNDGIVPRIYWENLRYAAGDFRNGCTDPGNPAFDPAARVHASEMCVATGLGTSPRVPMRTGLMVSHGGRRTWIAVPLAGPLRIRLLDLRGVVVRERTLPGGAGEMALDQTVTPGVYHVEVAGPSGTYRGRLALP